MRIRITIRGVALSALAVVTTLSSGVTLDGALLEPTASQHRVTPRAAPSGRALPWAAGVHSSDVRAGPRVHHLRAMEKSVKRLAALRLARAVRRAEQRAARNAVRDPRSAARTMAAARYGWGAGEFQCLDSLWQKESGWDYRAANPTSGAYGIPQALPGSKMATTGADWRTNPVTQIAWGLGYVDRSYGTPCSAWSHSQANGWY